MSSTLTDGAFSLVSAYRDFGLGVAMPATPPPIIAPATSTVPTEIHKRMAALPSFHEDGDTQSAPRKAETRNCRSRSQQSPVARRGTFHVRKKNPRRVKRLLFAFAAASTSSARLLIASRSATARGSA